MDMSFEDVNPERESLPILIADRAMPDPAVADLLLSFACEVSGLMRSAEDPVKYHDIAQELCRLSRRVIWSFASSVFCSAHQVSSATAQFADAAELIRPERACDEDATAGYQTTIRRRSLELRAVLDDRPPLGSGFFNSLRERSSLTSPKSR